MAPRDPMDHGRIGRVPGIQVVRNLVRAVAERSIRSAAWMRDSLQNPSARTRRRPSTRHPVNSGPVIPLRAEYGSWTAAGATATSAKPTRPARHRRATGAGLHNGAEGDGTTCHDDAMRHRDEIRTAYWGGQTLEALSDQWGVSPKTIVVLAYGD